MSVVIKVLGLADGTPTGFDGEYLLTCDAGRNGREPLSGQPMTAYMVTTPVLAQATRYETQEAIDLWRQVDPGRPVRADGKPNRPFTAFHIEMFDPDVVQDP